MHIYQAAIHKRLDTNYLVTNNVCFTLIFDLVDQQLLDHCVVINLTRSHSHYDIINTCTFRTIEHLGHIWVTWLFTVLLLGGKYHQTCSVCYVKSGLSRTMLRQRLCWGEALQNRGWLCRCPGQYNRWQAIYCKWLSKTERIEQNSK